MKITEVFFCLLKIKSFLPAILTYFVTVSEKNFMWPLKLFVTMLFIVLPLKGSVLHIIRIYFIFDKVMIEILLFNCSWGEKNVFKIYFYFAITSPLEYKRCNEVFLLLRIDWHRPFNNEGSLACNIYCDTRHPFYNGHLQGQWHSQLLLSV